MSKEWTSEEILEAARSYQSACVILAAAELDVIGALARGPKSAAGLADAIRGDERGTAVLADALAALGILEKHGGAYSPAPGVAELFVEGAPGSVLPMLLHQASCLRSWAQLAAVVRSGRPCDPPAGIRGPESDRSAFIEAMEVASREAAPRVVAGLGRLDFDELLDVGGGPGTWTAAFLRANPRARATLYDLPHVIPIARRHLEAAGLAGRVSFVEGDFTVDAALPVGRGDVRREHAGQDRQGPDLQPAGNGRGSAPRRVRRARADSRAAGHGLGGARLEGRMIRGPERRGAAVR